MNWYHIKSVLICLFAAINLFLVALLGVTQYRNTRQEIAKIEAATQVLSQNGISVSAAVPHKTVRLGGLRLENPKADPLEFAARILGGKATRFGETYRRGGKEVRLLEKGFIYESGLESVTPLSKNIRESREALSAMGFSMEYAKGSLEGDAVVFRQEVDGARLFDCEMCVQIAADGTISRISGNWANITDRTGEKVQITSAADALLTFLQTGAASEITTVEYGYAIFVEDDGYRAADAIPVWAIRAGEGETRYLDARR